MQRNKEHKGAVRNSLKRTSIKSSADVQKMMRSTTFLYSSFKEAEGKVKEIKMLCYPLYLFST